MSALNCAVCGAPEKESLVSLRCGLFDGSTLYPEVRLVACPICGHTYNDLSQDELDGLGRYYDKEYAPANLSSVVKDGDLPGSTGAFTNERYTQLYDMLSPHLLPGASVLDVGCAVGGFLGFLGQKGTFELCGVDMAEIYVTEARENGLIVELGDAEHLPFGDGHFDVLIIEQVLEHLAHPGVAFSEARRVLKTDGVLCIGVPDAAYYNDHYYFDFYWILMREHIQHFDVRGLASLAALYGFELIDHRQSSLSIMSDKMVMPNLSAIFRCADMPSPMVSVLPSSQLLSLMRCYVATEVARLDDKRRILRELAESQRPVFVWGIGREFLYLYEAAALKDCNIAGLIDMNPFKQCTVTLDSRIVEPSSVLERAELNAVLLITAVAHENSIRMNAIRVGFMGEIVSMLA